MSSDQPGREPVQIVEIVQPLCTHEYGVSPCTASGLARFSCYNTRATCQDPDNYNAGTLSLYFGKGRPGEQGIVPYLIPSLVSVSTSPTKVNIASGSSDSQGLGNRALCSIVFQDHQHTDRIVDPYLDDRTWNPLNKDRGSFWSRWLVRNKYWKNLQIIVYEGYAGDTLAQMVSRKYFIDSITPPNARGRVTIKGKDILARIEERKAQAPTASPGELFVDIDEEQTDMVVANAVLADYDSAGTVRISDEIIRYTSTNTAPNGVRLNGLTRGSDNTEAAEHSAGDAVQQCLRYDSQRPNYVIEDLLTTYGGVDPAYIPSVAWLNEMKKFLSLYQIEGLITEPESVNKLVSEICEQCCIFIFWDERDERIKMRATTGAPVEPDILTDQKHILADSLSVSEKPRERVSQVWFYYGQDDFTASDDEAAAFSRQYVLADLDSELPEQYGEPAVRKIYSRWIKNTILAQNTATRILFRYRDIPTEIKFRLDAKDDKYWVGDVVEIDHHFDIDEYGRRKRRRWTIVSAEYVVPGEVIEYVAEDTTLYGISFYIMPAGSADYPGYDNAPEKNCYIGNSSGLLSDGEDCGRIS